MTIGVLERFFHWTVALLMISLLSVGLYMATFSDYSLYPIHKSMGVLALLLILPRVVIRVIKGWPSPPANSHYASYEILLSKIVHWVLIIGTIMMPISGMLMSGAAGFGIYVFGVELLAQNTNAAGDIQAINTTFAQLGATIHGLLGKVLIGCIVLHTVGAFKHHIIDKDDTLKRMLKG